MKASEARQLTNNFLMNKENIYKIYNKAERWIEWAARQGKCYIEFDKAVETTAPGIRLCIRYMLLADGFNIIPKEELGQIWDGTDCICW